MNTYLCVGPWVWIKEESEEKGKEKTKCELHGRHIDCD